VEVFMKPLQWFSSFDTCFSAVLDDQVSFRYSFSKNDCAFLNRWLHILLTFP